MKITIVTVSFNQAEFLEQCIRSVLSQGTDELEYIVIDPGSTDGSRNIIEKYRDSIDQIVFEKDHGPADGLNRGFARASGDVYGFLNSDDILLPGALTHVRKAFGAHLDIDVLSGDGLVIDESGNKIRKCYSDRFSVQPYVYGSCVLVQPSTFFRSSVFKLTRGFNSENKTNWDGELFVDMAMRGARFARTKTLLSGYRLHSTSITASGKLDAAIAAHGRYIFHKVNGRSYNSLDHIISLGFRLFKHCSNPSALYERLKMGKIYRRIS